MQDVNRMEGRRNLLDGKGCFVWYGCLIPSLEPCATSAVPDLEPYFQSPVSWKAAQ